MSQELGGRIDEVLALLESVTYLPPPWTVIEDKIPHYLAGEHVQRMLITDYRVPQAGGPLAITGIATGVGATQDSPAVQFAFMSADHAALIVAAVNLLRTHGAEIRQALAGAEVAGGYECICHSCGEHFIGPKRSVTCADCATRPAPGRDGFVMVPVEPTREMSMAGWDSGKLVGDTLVILDLTEAYKAMIAAAPAPRPADPDFVRRIEP